MLRDEDGLKWCIALHGLEARVTRGAVRWNPLPAVPRRTEGGKDSEVVEVEVVQVFESFFFGFGEVGFEGFGGGVGRDAPVFG